MLSENRGYRITNLKFSKTVVLALTMGLHRLLHCQISLSERLAANPGGSIFPHRAHTGQYTREGALMYKLKNFTKEKLQMFLFSVVTLQNWVQDVVIGVIVHIIDLEVAAFLVAGHINHNLLGRMLNDGLTTHLSPWQFSYQ